MPILWRHSIFKNRALRASFSITIIFKDSKINLLQPGKNHNDHPVKVKKRPLTDRFFPLKKLVKKHLNFIKPLVIPNQSTQNNLRTKPNNL